MGPDVAFSSLEVQPQQRGLMGSRYLKDEIVEERTWRSGVEVVSRMNWSHLARVRRSLGLMSESFTVSPAVTTVTAANSSLPKPILPQWQPRAA